MAAAGKRGNKKGDKSKGSKSAGKKGKDQPEAVVALVPPPEVETGKKTKKSKGSKKQKNKAVTSNGGEKSKKKRRQQQAESSSSSFPAGGAASNVITEKEVFASGDKIMVSVNFRKNSPPPVYNPPTAAEIAAKTKPSAILDLTADDVDYTVIEKSPEQIIDVFSDDENDSGKGNKKNKAGGGQDKNGQDKAAGGNEVSMVTNTVVNGVVVSTR